MAEERKMHSSAENRIPVTQTPARSFNIVIFPQKSFTLNCVRSAYVRNTNGNICLRMYLKIINQKRTIKYRKTTSWKYLRIHIYTPVATFKAERRHFGYK